MYVDGGKAAAHKRRDKDYPRTSGMCIRRAWCSGRSGHNRQGSGGATLQSLLSRSFLNWAITLGQSIKQALILSFPFGESMEEVSYVHIHQSVIDHGGNQGNWKVEKGSQARKEKEIAWQRSSYLHIFLKHIPSLLFKLTYFVFNP